MASARKATLNILVVTCRPVSKATVRPSYAQLIAPLHNVGHFSQNATVGMRA